MKIILYNMLYKEVYSNICTLMRRKNIFKVRKSIEKLAIVNTFYIFANVLGISCEKILKFVSLESPLLIHFL